MVGAILAVVPMSDKQMTHLDRKWQKLLKRELSQNKREREIGINTLALKGRLPA